MTFVYDLIYLLALALGWPLLLVRRVRRGPGSLALRERLGGPPARPAGGRCVWVHAVSLGEVNATRTLVDELKRRAPDTTVVISSTTATGLARARALYPDLTVFRFPLDLSFVIARAFARIRPDLIVLMELEVWPNLVEVAARRGVPVVIANGRVTGERSMRRFALPVVRAAARRMFGRLAWVGAQDETYAERFARLGVPAERIEVTGSVKYDTADVRDEVEGQQPLAAELGICPRTPLLVCGSTGPGEEAIILDAYEALRARGAAMQLAIVPRRPERFDEVAELIGRRGLRVRRRSGAAAPPTPAGDPGAPLVYLGDTLGELRKFYALGAIVFVGRSLVPMGGSDLIEAAALGKPVLVGPHMSNFDEPVRALRAAGACLEVDGADALASAVVELLEDAQRRARMGRQAREAILARRGATRRTVTRVLTLLGTAPSAAPEVAAAPGAAPDAAPSSGAAAAQSVPKKQAG